MNGVEDPDYSSPHVRHSALRRDSVPACSCMVDGSIDEEDKEEEE